MDNDNANYKTALGGIISALCLMLMFTTSLSPVLYLVMPMLAGLLLMIMIFEAGIKWAWTAYLSVSILSILITFNKEAVLMFIMFFGHYPMLKQYIDKIKLGILRKSVKFLLYNFCIISEFAVTIYIFGIADMLDEMNDFGKYGFWIMLALSNIIFISYDMALSNCFEIYVKWFRPKILCKK
jgi:hypothetical protein